MPKTRGGEAPKSEPTVNSLAMFLAADLAGNNVQRQVGFRDLGKGDSDHLKGTFRMSGVEGSDFRVHRAKGVFGHSGFCSAVSDVGWSRIKIKVVRTIAHVWLKQTGIMKRVRIGVILLSRLE